MRYMCVSYVFAGNRIMEKDFSSVAQSCPTLCDPMDCSNPGLLVPHQLPESTQTQSIELVMPSNHLILCRPFPAATVFPSIRVFSNESPLRIRWPKDWSFSFNISCSNEHPDWSPLGWTGWISLQSKGLLESSPTPQFKSISFSVLSFLYSILLLIWFFSLCFLMSLANGLSILFIFSKNQVLALLIFAMVCFFCIYFCPNF